ncbi:MAG: lipocalin-like domain-containing protein [Dehalococcoidia bacterium]|jgi:hypothetical protein
MLKKEFIGTWKLKSYEVRWASGKVTHTFGENPQGLLIYTENGYMAANMMSANRANFEARDIRLGTTEEKAHAAETYVSYSGRYEFEEDKVKHIVEVCLFPNWVGRELVRIYDLQGDTLVLKTIPDPKDEQGRQGYLIWERVK